MHRLLSRAILLMALLAPFCAPTARGQQQPRATFAPSGTALPARAAVRYARPLPAAVGRAWQGRADVRWVLDGRVRPFPDPAGRAIPVQVVGEGTARGLTGGRWQAAEAVAPGTYVLTGSAGAERAWPLAGAAMAALSNPTLGTVSITPGTVNTDNGPVDVVVDAQLLDAVGVSQASFILTETGSGAVLFGAPALASGTAQNGVWRATISVGEFAAPGAYTLSIFASSTSGGFSYLETSARLTVAGTGDTSPPTLNGPATITPGTVDLSGGPATVAIRVPLADAPAGVSYVGFSLVMGDESIYGGHVEQVSGTAQEGVWASTATIPQNTMPGVYTLQVYASDNANNGETFVTGATLRVGGGDTQPPALVGVPTVSPPAVSLARAAAAVTVTLRAQDDDAGVASVSAYFRMGDETIYAEAARTGGDARDGTWRALFDVPRSTPEGRYTLVVTLDDAAGNTRTIETTATLDVTGSDVLPPALTAAITRSPAALDLAGGPQTVVVDVPLRDPSGVEMVYVHLTRDDTTSLGGEATLVSGDSLQGVWRARIAVPLATPDGLFALRVQARDREDNDGFFEPDLPVAITGGDLTPPALDGPITAVPATLDLTPGSGTAAVRVPLRDAQTGAARVYVRLFNPDAQVAFGASARLASGTARQGVWEATFDVPQTATPGTYRAEVQVEDVAYNSALFTAAGVLTLTIHLPGPPASPIPADGALDVPERPYLAWQPGEAALRYDLYLWRDGQPEPATPLRADLSDPQLALADTLPAGTRYAWRVVAKNGAGAAPGPVWHFTTRRLADLRVARVQAPARAESGQTVEVSWTVENRGGAPTDVARWYDGIYLSTDTLFDAPRSGGAGSVGDVLLARVQNATALEPGKQYRNSTTVQLPRRQYGQLYVLVVTNVGAGGEKQREASSGLDNVGHAATQLVLPPAPDLEPTALVVPPTVFAGQPFSVRWTVTNTGEGSTYGSAWDDIIYLTRDSVLAVGREITKLRYRRILNIKPDSSYTHVYSMTLPDSVAGRVYAHLVVDAMDYEFEPGGETNNTLRTHFDAVLTPPADLTAAIRTAPAAGASGQSVKVAWTVKNEGAGTTTTYWRDALYLSPTATLDTSTARLLGQFYNVQALARDGEYTQEKDARLPDDVAGTHYLFVVTDVDNRVFEQVFETNNQSAARPIEVAASPTPDLVPARVDAPALATAGDAIPVSWSVRNAGAARAGAGAWRDSLFLSASPTWTRAGALPLGVAYAPDSLGAGRTSLRSLSAPLPTDLAAGTYYVYVVLDAGQALYERGGEGNNVGRSAALTVGAYPSVDLAVVEVEAPAQAGAGAALPVTFTIRNGGGGATLVRQWTDEVFISPVDTFSTAARTIGFAPHREPVAGGAQYTQTLQARLPDDLEPGRYFVLVSTTFPDGAPRNNTRASAALTVTLSPPPDLVVAGVTAPASLTAGQPVTLAWKVKNAGTGATRDTLWYDGVWLARSATTTEGAVKLGQFVRTAVLAGAGEYTAQVEVTIPFYAAGAYYLFVKTDDGGRIYEANREDNNTRIVPVQVVLPPPADLVVRDVQVPAQATVGEYLTVTYTIENRGANVAFGKMTTGLYVSPDTLWNADDALLLLDEQQVNLAPGGVLRVSSKLDLSARIAADAAVAAAGGQQATAPLPGVAPGRYHVLVRADLRNNIRESDDANNTAASASTADVTVPTLALGTPVTRRFDYRPSYYYRVDVPAGLDLRLTLTRSAGVLPGGVYVAYGRVPTPSDYDYAAANASDETRQLVVPSTQAGTYYVLVRGELIYFDNETFTLLGEALGFSVAGVSQRRLGQGVVTTRLTGAGFRPASRVVLRQGAQTVAEAAVQQVASTTEMVVQWNLAAVPVGQYTLAVRNGDVEAVLDEPIFVEPVVRPRLETVHAAPGPLLAARRTEYVYQFRNTGNIDVPFGTIVLSVPKGTGVAIETDSRLRTLKDLRDEGGVDDDEEHPWWFEGERERIIPVWVRNVAPGEPLETQLTVVPPAPGTPGPQEFPVRVTVKVEDTETFVGEQLQTIESLRQTVLQHQERVHPQIADMARNRRDFARYMLDGFRRTGMLDEGEVDKALDRIPDILPRGAQTIEYGDILKKTCDGIFFVTGCVASILDCTPELAFIPLSAGASAAMCAFGVTAGCTPALDKASDASGIDLSLAGCIGIASALNCIAKEVVCNHLVASLDPNDIAGPEGWGDGRWVPRSRPIPYKIRFENSAEQATAPAQEVRISLPLDADLDARTFRLGRLGFGLMQFDVPENAAFYTTRLDARDSLGVYVDVTAGVDVQARRAFWTLRAVDPATGTLPSNPYVGVLAINDSLGRGEGFVTFSVRPVAEAATGTRVDAQATIEFDLNAPIATPVWTNTLDAAAPTSRIAALAGPPDEGRIALSWQGEDDAGGTGVDHYTLYVAEGGEAFRPYASDLTDTRFVYPGTPGASYRFFVLATDRAGNTEDVKAEADVVVTRAEAPAELPTAFSLEPNFPNPFSSATTLRYALPEPALVTLEVFNVVGQRVAVLEAETAQPAGWHTAPFDGSALASGVYFYRLHARGTGDARWLKTGKMVLVR